MINIGTAVTVGIVNTAKKNTIEVKLVRPVAGAPGQRVAISRQSESGRFRLVGIRDNKRLACDELER